MLVRRFVITLVVAAVAACTTAPSPSADRSADGSQVATSSPSSAATASAFAHPVASVVATGWEGGAYLPSGYRSAILDGETIWIVTQPSQNQSLVLTKVSTIDYQMSATVLETNLSWWAGVAGLALDGLGSLWVAYGDMVVQVDIATGAMRRWPLPVLNATHTNHPGGGPVVGAVWDSASGTLLYARNVDHRLYRLDPRNGKVTTALDIGVWTTNLSTMTSDDDGNVAVNGSAKVGTYDPAAVRITSGNVKLIPNVGNVCSTRNAAIMLGRDGAVTAIDGDSESLIRRVPALQGSLNPFACNDRYIFETRDAFGQVVVERIGLDGEASEVRLRLTGGGPAILHGNYYPHIFGAAEVLGLVADESQGVWLYMLSGEDTIEGQIQTSEYPSLLHITFGPERVRTPVD